MKKVVSISLGSSKRDYSCVVDIIGTKYSIERIGFDGDFKKVIEKIYELDGKVDAFGMGGIDLFLQAGDRKYVLKKALPIKNAAKKTPIYDGSNFKNTMERAIVNNLMKDGIVNFKGKKVLVTSALDRFGMAEAIDQCGGRLVIGDIIFGLKMNIPIYSIKALNNIAKIIFPLVCRLPFEMLYPIGEHQQKRVNRFAEYYNNADIIAGDFHYIKRFMPNKLAGKVIITNTVTKEDLDELKQREVKILITTTPKLGERSFGTNVIEALIESVIKENSKKYHFKTYNEVYNYIGLKPRIEYLN